MVRLSDILKKKIKINLPTEQVKSEERQSPPSPIEITKIMGKEVQGPEKPLELQIAAALKNTVDTQRSKDIYAKGMQLIKELSKAAQEGKAVELKPVRDWADEVIDCFVLQDKTLFSLFYEDYPAQEELYNHTLNVAAMSIALGLRLGYNKSRLAELGLCAFLYDTNFKPQEVPEFSQIIGIVDEYEVLTHSRHERKKILPYQALKEMVSSHKFDSHLLKSLIDLIGVYPSGSYVELNTNEIAKVIVSNTDFPLRPIVSIIFDAAKNKLEQPRLINLAKQLNLYIKKPLYDEEISSLAKS